MWISGLGTTQPHPKSVFAWVQYGNPTLLLFDEYGVVPLNRFYECVYECVEILFLLVCMYIYQRLWPISFQKSDEP